MSGFSASSGTPIRLFIPGGHVIWSIGLLMGAGQLIGAWIGSHMVMRHGAGLVRPVLVLVSIAVSIKLLFG